MEELLGHWSVDHGYHSSMEDEWLFLRPDGTGWYEYLRPSYADRTAFRWEPAGAGRVRVRADEQVTTDESGEERTAIEIDETVPYEITTGTRPLLDEPVRLLRIGLPFGLGEQFAFRSAGEPSPA